MSDEPSWSAPLVPSLPTRKKSKAAAGLRSARRLSRKAGMIRSPCANVAASGEEKVRPRGQAERERRGKGTDQADAE